MKRNGLLFFLSLFSITAFGEVFPIEGGERSFIDGDVLNTFRASDKLVVTDATTVHALFVAGAGWNSSFIGGSGGDGIVILRYAFDFSTKAEPYCFVNNISPAIAGAAIDIGVESIGASATFLDISATAMPVNGVLFCVKVDMDTISKNYKGTKL